ncbi:fumarylacetoacetate hydrolase family protein [Oleisolibacter albus]|uniref:fumarylacetoacetate hydrolase family protein n=1 Tax=Oleisolibacter albus TaxID=2171757 RepID=UPI000DF236FC|nr:fumarylacetoacetate hydrolase family protein [Oleisolibacter albus]
MKLLRHGPKGAERPGLLAADGSIRDLSAHVDDIAGAVLSDAGLDRLRAVDPLSLPVAAPGTRLGPCVGRVGKFIGIGLNYADHAAETGVPLPPEPLMFLKATSCISGPDDDIIQPRGSTKLDWEVELALVIGRPVAYADEAEAAASIAGWCVCNDISERNFQLERAGQWDKGKGCDSFGPIGPWLVTRDEVADPTNLSMWLEVNGQRRQQGSTRTMVFKPAFLVSYVSQFMSLQPGDIITTGTPPGVGMGQKPPVWLKPGDRMRLGVEGLGEQRQTVVACP